MTWREFQLKRHGYLRSKKNESNHFGIVAYMIYLSIPEAKGKTKKTFEQWWLSESKKGVEDWQKEMLRNAQLLAVEEAKNKKLING